MEQIHWFELPGNEYLKKLEPSMLTNEGCISKQEIKPVGKKTKQWISVLYDSNFVAAKLFIEVLRPLNIQSQEQLIQLMGVLWKIYESSQENESEILIDRDFVEKLRP